MSNETYAACRITAHGNQLLLEVSGRWDLQKPYPDLQQILPQLNAGGGGSLCFNCSKLQQWDSSLIIFLLKVLQSSLTNRITVDQSNLPDGAQRLLKLATTVPERKEMRRKILGQQVLAKIGNITIEAHRDWNDLLKFIGDVFFALLAFVRRRARFRTSDLLFQLEAAGPSALMIVTLISTLVGMILAFVGAVQLRLFGAEIFIANLVGLGMAREMGAMMTAIIMAGRTGAAFAAQIGTMQVNEEIDAFTTMAISPIEFLVLPRLIALFLTMPLLCIYSDFMGIIGGAIVSATMFDISFYQYFQQIQGFVPLKHFMIGIFKAGVFGVIIAAAGCLRGLQCARSASAVGFAATNAVVTSIVLIIVADAVITVLCQLLGL